MIIELKNERGYQFTSKLECMSSDMKISKVCVVVERAWTAGGFG